MFTKRINDVLDFDFDFTLWLADHDSDSIVSQSVIAPGLVIGAVTQSNGVVKVFLSGGVKGLNTTVVCKIITLGGRTKEVTTNMTITN
jgi:hypothetical protein